MGYPTGLEAIRFRMEQAELSPPLVLPSPGSLTRQQSATSMPNIFIKQAKELGYLIRFHDLRGTRAVALA
jgi:hypothetical protein